MSGPEQFTVPCVIMRGGTSKALFFHEYDVPPPGAERDRMLKRAMGAPDVMQIDGLGGARLVTSKVAIIKRSTRKDADIDYTFAQVDIELDHITYDGNCGNISSGVGPFAIDEGLVEAVEPITTVRIYNTNTRKVLVAKIPVHEGRARVHGDFAIAGVPGRGAEITMDYSGTIGAVSGRLLPTGNVLDRIQLENGNSISFSLCDAGNPCVFVAATDLGITGQELPANISSNKGLIATIDEILAKALTATGMVKDWKQTLALPTKPLFVAVSPPAEYVDMNRETQKAEGMDLCCRLVFLSKCHESMAGTGAISTSAASRVQGSVVHRAIRAEALDRDLLRIGHPLGVMETTVRLAEGCDSAAPKFSVLGFARTARRLMAGNLYLPASQ